MSDARWPLIRCVSLLTGAVMLGATCLTADAAQTRKSFEILRISPLRIMCFTTPCPPWNAMAISRGVEVPGPDPLYLGPLPSLRGTKADMRRIAVIWRRKDCVIIHGRLNKTGKSSLLFVNRILRSC